MEGGFKTMLRFGLRVAFLAAGAAFASGSGAQDVPDAAPFAPLPRTESPVEVLHITRTWEFVPGDSVKMQ